MKASVNQKDIEMEIIVSDDGSKENYLVDCIKFFEKNDIKNWKYVLHNNNQGTVSNVLDAVCIATGSYVKLLSPGDFFSNKKILSSWIKFLKESGKEWSFGDVIYYCNNDGSRQVLKLLKRPYLIGCYKKHNNNKCRLNYLLNNDLVIGASVLCKRKAMLEYLKKIAGRVVYAEDNIFRIMMFDGLVPEYYPFDVIFYEYGDGISTNGDKEWEEKLKKDWAITDKLMISSRTAVDAIQIQILDNYEKKYRDENNYLISMFNKINDYFVYKKYLWTIMRRIVKVFKLRV